MCSPHRYEIYETSDAWATYLTRTFDVIRHPTDGKSLRATPDASRGSHPGSQGVQHDPVPSDLRVLDRDGTRDASRGYVVFDIMSEDCLDLTTLQRWVDSGIENGSYPAVMPRSLAIDYFQSCSFKVVGSFFVAMEGGKQSACISQMCKRNMPVW